MSINPGDRELSFGERMVGLRFNPGGLTAVDECKMNFAKVIDQLNNLRSDSVVSPGPDKLRLIAVAITQAQTAQMWAVKAITWTD